MFIYNWGIVRWIRYVIFFIVSFFVFYIECYFYEDWVEWIYVKYDINDDVDDIWFFNEYVFVVFCVILNWKFYFNVRDIIDEVFKFVFFEFCKI